MSGGTRVILRSLGYILYIYNFIQVHFYKKLHYYFQLDSR